MALAKKYILLVEKINSRIGNVISWFTALLVITVCIDVFIRYFLEYSFTALQELEWHFFSIIFLFGAAYTLKTDNHVRVDLFYSKFNPKKKALVNLLGSLFFLIPFCLLAIYASHDFVMISFKIGETSPDPGGLPARYILKSLLPVSFVFLLLQSVSLLLNSLLALIGDKEIE